MSIGKYLDKIRNAIYGREVRESIAKGIETAYNDAAEKHDNANMEVKLARGTHSNLNNRLDKMDEVDKQTTTQLAQKADKKHLEAEKERIDKLIAPEAGEDNAETADIRIGHDGKIYKSAGTAVRKQISAVDAKKVGGKPIKKQETVEWEMGGISTTTGEETENNDRIRTKGYFSGATIEVNLSGKTGGRWAAYRYDNEGNFIKTDVNSFRGEYYELNPNYQYRLLYAFVSEDYDPVRDGADFEIYNLIEPYEIQKKAIQEEHLSDNLKYGLSQKNLSNKFMHISSDDMIDVFKDLTTNSETYTSIFDNSNLAFLKSLHDQYGMTFSGYCFYTDGSGFDLSQATSKFAQEFNENSHWLKWGFHSNDSSVNYSSETGEKAQVDYEKLMTELFRIVGGASSFDLVIRTHNYAGNKEAIEAFRDTGVGGVLGFLSSEDNRMSYNHSVYQHDFLKTHDRLYDKETRMTYFSTDLRLERVESMVNELITITSDVNFASRQNDLIIFTHENRLHLEDIRLKIEQACKFAVENGYDFDFPMNKILN